VRAPHQAQLTDFMYDYIVTFVFYTTGYCNFWAIVQIRGREHYS